MRRWERWPVIDTSTFFFRVPAGDVAHLGPLSPLRVYEKDGFAEIEVGYVHFSGGPAAKPNIGPTLELSWGLRVVTKEGPARFAFLQKNLSSDNPVFVEDANREGFTTPDYRLKFDISPDGSRIDVAELGGDPIVSLTRSRTGEVPLPRMLAPAILGESDVWTQQKGKPLYYRKFKWSGPARVQLNPRSPCTLFNHPFFKGITPTKAHPIPHQVFSAALEKNGRARESYQEFWLRPKKVR